MFWAWLILLLAAVALMFWPVDYYRVINEGTDSFETHHALYGERKKSQLITIDGKIHGAGAVLVDLRRSFQLTPVTVGVYGVDGELLVQGEIRPKDMADDAMAWVKLPDEINRGGEEVRLEFSAPRATSANAVGLRFEKDAGYLAVGVIERLPMWERLMRWADDNLEAANKLIKVVGGGLVIAVILPLAALKKRRGVGSGWLWMLMVLAILAVAIRIPTALKIDSAFGGDAFNYLMQSRAWLEGANPFAEEFRRKAPFLPLLLMPGFIDFIDPMMWGRIISIAAAVGTVIAVPFLLVHWSMPRPLAAGAGLLLAVNRGWWWESVHGLANTLYAALIVGAIYALVMDKRKRSRYLAGVLVGLSYLARWEGGLVAAVLLPAVWIRRRLRMGAIVYMILPAVILMAIPFVMWPVTGETGMRTPADIVGDGGLGLIASFDDFISNWSGFKLFFGRNWLLVESVGNQFVYFGAGILLGMGIEFLRKIRSRLFGWLISCAPYALMILITGTVILNSLRAQEVTVLLLALLMGTGAGALLWRWPKQAIPIYVMLAVQVAAVVAILPKPRYFLQLIPMMSVWLVFGLGALDNGAKRKVGRAGTLIVTGMLVMLVYVDSSLAMPGAISDYNEKSQAQTIMLKAARYVRELEGRVTVLEERDLPIRSYLRGERVEVVSLSEARAIKKLPDEEVWEWLTGRKITYVVEAGNEPVFLVEDRFPGRFNQLYEAGTRYGNTKATVYKLLPAGDVE